MLRNKLSNRTRRVLGILAILGAGLVLVNLSAPAVASNPLTVLVIGGSAARGWHDTKGPGYIGRALGYWSRQVGIPVRVENHGVPGAPTTSPWVAERYPVWLAALHPRVVVLAWGLLNDLQVHTPPREVGVMVQQEINQALEAGAQVWVVTPPATLATYTFGKTQEAAMLSQELAVAKRFPTPLVRTFNVLAPMVQRLHADHQSIMPLMHDRWDPSTQGHRIAGAILGQELRQRVIPGSLVKPAPLFPLALPHSATPSK